MRSILALVPFLFWTSAHAQMDLGTASMQGIWQASYANPAAFPDHKVVLALPGIHAHIANSSFAWRDVVVEDGAGNRSLDIDRLLPLLDADNILRQQSDIPTLALGIRAGNWFFHAGHQIRSNSALAYPRTLAQLLWKGNAQFIGQTVSIGPSFQASAFHEFFIGAAIQPNERWSFGGRIKMLNGIANFSTSKSRLLLSTSDDVYQLLLQSDYQINATAQFTYAGLSDVVLDIDRADYALEQLFGINPGVALDLGVQYRSGPLALQASVLDLGRILWKQDAGNLSLSGDFEFKGLDVFRQLLEDENTTAGGVIDSLEALYDVRQTSAQYRTALPMRMFAGASYDLSTIFQLTGTLLGEMSNGSLYPALALGGRARLGRILDIGALYAIRHNRFNHFGLNAALTLGPIQLIAATDHLGAFLNPESARQANLRIGANLVFARQDREKRNQTRSKTLDERKFF